MYKVTFTPTQSDVSRLKEKKCYPFQRGEYSFADGDAIECDGLAWLLNDPREAKWNPELTSDKMIELGLLDHRFKVEKINGDVSEAEV